MGHLRKTRGPKRARDEEDKAARKQALLSAARALFSSAPYDAVKVRDIAKKASLAKGTFYLYFDTKEELFLSLLTAELDSLLHELETRLTPRMAVTTLAQTLSQAVVERPALVRLIALMHVVLEHNVPLEVAAEFKRHWLTQSSRLAALLTRARPKLSQEDAMRLVLRAFALVIGLGQMSDPSRVVLRALDATPSLSAFRIDLEAELGDAFHAEIAHAERSHTHPPPSKRS